MADAGNREWEKRVGYKRAIAARAAVLEADGATRRPFNLADLVRYERLDNRGRANPAYLCAERGVLAHAAAAGGDVVSNLAIARTGSETLALFLRALGQPSHHGHDCTLVDVAPAVRGALSSPCGTHLHGSCRASSDAWKATTSARCGTA